MVRQVHLHVWLRVTQTPLCGRDGLQAVQVVREAVHLRRKLATSDRDQDNRPQTRTQELLHPASSLFR